MAKPSKSKKAKQLKEYHVVGSLFMRHDETTIEDVYEHLFDLKKFYKWMNFFPHNWMSSKDKVYKAGLVFLFRLIFPPMTFKITITEILPNHGGINFTVTGWMKGNGMWEFIRDEKGILCKHTMILTGANKFLHYYYPIVKLGHDKYFPWRLSILKKMLIQYSKEKRQGETAK